MTAKNTNKFNCIGQEAMHADISEETREGGIRISLVGSKCKDIVNIYLYIYVYTHVVLTVAAANANCVVATKNRF